MTNKDNETHVSTTKRENENGAAARHAGEDKDDPRLPHERDQASFDESRDEPDAIMKRAHDDIEEGQIDTDRRGIPGVEEVERSKPSNAQPEIPESSRMPASVPKK